MIRETVIRVMQEREISQRALSRTTGICTPALNRWIRGHISMNERGLEVILKALGLTLQPSWRKEDATAGALLRRLDWPPKQGTDKMARVMSEMPEWPWSQEYGAKPSPDATTPKRV